MTAQARDLIFSDEVVTPTELARQARKITQSALNRPVTVHRSEGDLALLARDKVHDLAAASAAAEDVVDFGRNFLWMLRGKGRPSPTWAWLEAFSPDDVADFLEEYLSAVDRALHGRGDWNLPPSIVHEWQESASALSHHSLLAEWSAFRGVATEDEAARLTAEELRSRLAAAISTLAGEHAS